MCLRSAKERVIQVIFYETFALCLTVPLYALLLNRPAAQAVLVVVGLTLFEVAWGLLHDWLYDKVELRLTARRADLRPIRWRCFHAFSREATLLVLSVPAIMLLAGVGFWTAVGVDIALTLVFMLYSFVFFRLYDWARPIDPTRSVRVS